MSYALLQTRSAYFDLYTNCLSSQIGKSQVFLRAGQMAELDAKRTEVHRKAARTIQNKIRTHITRLGFLSMQKAAKHLQSFCRGMFKNYIF